MRLFDSEQLHKDFPVLNMSRGGLCFSSREVFVVDERVNITVFKDDKEAHQATGRICYRTETENGTDLYGISFLDKYLSTEIPLQNTGS